jgi:hypothetical protein
VAAALLFVGAAAAAGDDGAEDPAPSPVSTTVTALGGGPDPVAEAEAEASSAEETVFGLDADSPALVGLIALVGIGLAAAVVLQPSKPLWIAVLAFGLVALLFDMGFIAQEISDDEMGVATALAVVGLLHFAAAGAAGMLLGGSPSVQGQPGGD